MLSPVVASATATHCSGVSRFNLHKLQCIQNCVARIVSNTKRYSRITPVLKALHWLPIEQRSKFKTMTLVYKFLHTGVPKYFEPYISPQQSIYNTRRSQSQGSFLIVPKFHYSRHKSAKQFGHSFQGAKFGKNSYRTTGPVSCSEAEKLPVRKKFYQSA